MRLVPEIALGRTPSLLGATVYVLAALFWVALMWSYFTRVEVVVRAPGVVRPEGEVVRITTEADGTIAAVYVQEGDMVGTGDILVRMDDGATHAGRQTLLEQIDLLESQLEGIAQTGRDATSIFQLEERKLEIEIRTAEEDLERRWASHEALLQSSELELERARNRHLRTEKLLKEGLVSVQSHDEIETALLIAQSVRFETESRAPTDTPFMSLIQARDLNQAQFEARRRELEATATPIYGRLAELRLGLQQASRTANRLTIRTPAKGKLTSLSTLHPGEHLRSGTLIATLAPTPIYLIVEAWLPNRDAPLVHRGQRVRLVTEDSETFDGYVLSISPDARLTDSGTGAYRVLITPDTNRKLHLGLALETRFVTREERVLSLLFRKIRKNFGS